MNSLPITSYGAWSAIYKSTNPPLTSNVPPATGGILAPLHTISDVTSSGGGFAHRLMTGFTWTGNKTSDGTTAELYRVYVFTDKQCLNPVYVSAVTGSPAYAPRIGGPLLLPQDSAGITLARSSYLDDGGEPTGAMFDGTPVVANEAAAPASPTTTAPPDNDPAGALLQLLRPQQRRRLPPCLGRLPAPLPRVGPAHPSTSGTPIRGPRAAITGRSSESDRKRRARPGHRALLHRALRRLDPRPGFRHIAICHRAVDHDRCGAEKRHRDDQRDRQRHHHPQLAAELWARDRRSDRKHELGERRLPGSRDAADDLRRRIEGSQSLASAAVWNRELSGDDDGAGALCDRPVADGSAHLGSAAGDLLRTTARRVASGPERGHLRSRMEQEGISV